MNKIDSLEAVNGPSINSKDIEKEMEKIESLAQLKNIHCKFFYLIFLIFR